MFGGGLIFLLFLLMGAAAIWTGLIGLRRSQRGLPDQRGQEWWLMAIGASIVILSPVVRISGLAAGIFDVYARTYLFIRELSLPLGFVMFSVGFALHGLRMARLRERIGELEQLTQAMDEEITRLRGETR